MMTSRENDLLLNDRFPVTVPLSILRNSRRQELEDTENQRLFLFERLMKRRDKRS